VSQFPSHDRPYLVLYDDNYFDLAQGESRTVTVKPIFPGQASGHLSGKITVAGSNVEPTEIKISG
jgi:Ig-fold domain